MHLLEPYYNWRHLYTAEADELSPFYGRTYSEFEYTTRIYNYYIHPQWDDFESQTLFCKIIFCNYDKSYCVIELIGEWNDALYNDIMFFKRNVIEELQQNGINQFIIVGENVLNFHSSDDCYYEEWFDENEESGWIVLVNFREHILEEFRQINADSYMMWGEEIDDIAWRTYKPDDLYLKIKLKLSKYLD